MSDGKSGNEAWCSRLPLLACLLPLLLLPGRMRLMAAGCRRYRAQPLGLNPPLM